jgi:hypothetical protein
MAEYKIRGNMNKKASAIPCLFFLDSREMKSSFKDRSFDFELKAVDLMQI